MTHATGPAFFYVAARFEAIQPSLLRVSDYRALLAILDRGRVVAEGAPNDLLARPEIRAAYLGIEAER